MKRQATELAQRLADSAEAVCRYYLPNGRRQGRYWLVGDVHGSKGQSLYVRLAGEGCGRWTDAATAERGDLLDLIRLNQGHLRLRDTLVEARRFLNEPQPAWMNGAGGAGGIIRTIPKPRSVFGAAASLSRARLPIAICVIAASPAPCQRTACAFIRGCFTGLMTRLRSRPGPRLLPL